MNKCCLLAEVPYPALPGSTSPTERCDFFPFQPAAIAHVKVLAEHYLFHFLPGRNPRLGSFHRSPRQALPRHHSLPTYPGRGDRQSPVDPLQFLQHTPFPHWFLILRVEGDSLYIHDDRIGGRMFQSCYGRYVETRRGQHGQMQISVDDE